MIQASCLCGNVQFQINAKVGNARYCHCSKCRKFSGTANAAWGLAPLSGLEVLRGGDGVHKYDSGGGHRVFCRTCGSPLWYEPFEHPEYIGLPLGVVDSGEVAPPSAHLWTSLSPEWEVICDGIPQFAQSGPNDSSRESRSDLSATDR